MSADLVRYTAAGGVVIDAGRALLLDRPSRGEVRLPKGHVEPGESAREAALRETVEESGFSDLLIVADLGRQVVCFEHEGDQVEREERYFLMRLRSGRIGERHPKDARQFQVMWVPLREAQECLTFEAEREWLRRAAVRYAADEDAPIPTA